MTVIDLQATIYTHNRPTFVTFANASSNRFQYGIIYSIFSCLVPRNSEFLATPQISEFGGRQIFFVPQTVDQVYATADGTSGTFKNQSSFVAGRNDTGCRLQCSGRGDDDGFMSPPADILGRCHVSSAFSTHRTSL